MVIQSDCELGGNFFSQFTMFRLKNWFDWENLLAFFVRNVQKKALFEWPIDLVKCPEMEKVIS